MQTSARIFGRAAKDGTQEPDAAPRAGAPAPRESETFPERPSTGPILVLARLAFVAHMLVAGNDGYFRDELYYIADGRHLQVGYVDQPLLTGWLAALLRLVAGDGLVAIHVIPALACAVLVITGLVARELGAVRGSASDLPPAVAHGQAVCLMPRHHAFQRTKRRQRLCFRMQRQRNRRLEARLTTCWRLTGSPSATAMS